MENKKQQLLDEATTLMMKYGIKSVSMDDLARHLGISKKTIYTYVDNKKDLVKQLVTQAIDSEKCHIEHLLQESEDAISEMLSIAQFVLTKLRKLGPSLVFDMKKYYPEEWRMMEEHQQAYVTKTISNNIQRGIDEGLYRPNIDPLMIAQLYDAMTHTIVDEERFPLRRYTKTDLYSHMIKYHLHGIVTDKGRSMLTLLNI